MRKRAVVLFVGVGVLAQSCGQHISYAYHAAMYTSVFGVSQELEVFPLDAESFSIPMPFPFDVLAYSPDGKSLYAPELFQGDVLIDPNRPKRRGLFKIEFNPVRATAVPGSAALGFHSFAVSADQHKIIIAGGKLGTPCGIFELSLPRGEVRTIVEDPSSNPLDPASCWWELSLSPDGTRATALRNHHLELIDLLTGKIEPFEGGIQLGAWSPDGKWFAASSPTIPLPTIILMDAKTLSRRRSLGVAEPRWSPDSRYLLNKKFRFQCGLAAFSGVGTLEMVNVETGQRIEIESSRCLIDRNTIGWVSSEIRPQQREKRAP